MYVPKLAANLFGARVAAMKGKVVQFGHTLCWIKNSQRKAVARGRLVGNMYRLNCRIEGEGKQVSVAAGSSNKLNLWHQRMAHLYAGHMKTMVSNEIVTGTDMSGTGNLDFCDACVEGKSHRAPFKAVEEVQSKKRLELVHSDVAGPMKTESLYEWNSTMRTNVRSLSVEMICLMKLTSDIQIEYNWKLKKKMTVPLMKNQLGNHPMLDVQHEKESHQFIQ